MKSRIKPIIVSPTATIREVMQVIERAPHAKPDPAPAGIVLICDRFRKLLGIATDGDIRKGLLSGASFDEPIEKVMNKKPITMPSDLSMAELMSVIVKETKKRKIVDRRLEKIILVNEKQEPFDIFSFLEVWKNSDIQWRQVSVIGLGYVGLTLSLTLADAGFLVYGVDVSSRVIRSLNRRVPHFHEVGLEPLLRHYVGSSFFPTTRITKAKSDVYVIAVNTPVNKKGKVDMTALRAAVSSVARQLKPHDLIVLRSTVALSTCRTVVVPLIKKIRGFDPGKDYYLAFAPERTVEGKALLELRTLPQVIGGFDKESSLLAARLFKSFTNQIVTVSSLEAAEMVKLLNNSFRDVSFGFANEIARVCDAAAVNAFEVINAANDGYPRNKIPLPSPGVGGICLVKDPHILTESAKKIGVPLLLPRAGRKANEYMAELVKNRVLKFVLANGLSPKKTSIFVLGVAFKGQPETSDIRNSPTIDVIRLLSKKFPRIFVYDKVVLQSELKRAGLKPRSLSEGFKESHIVLVLNNHDSFRELDIFSLLNMMPKPGFFFDGWNMFQKQTVEQVSGVQYGTIGV